MIRKRLLMLLTVLCSSYAAFAQDPSVGGIVISPNPLQVGQAASLTASFGNGSSTDIPQSATATYTVNLPPNVGITGYTVATVSPVAGTTANLSVTVGAYDGTNGTIVTIRSNNGALPGNAIYDLRLAIVGVKVTGGLPPNVLSNALSSGLGTNNPNNDNASTPVAVTAGALPVGLVSFTAKAQENRTVALAWTTSLETNNKGFLIERSKDLKGFETVGEVTELGANSNSLKNLTPYPGTSYYRLTQRDLDGKSTVFPVVSVVLREGSYGVFPNPVLNDQPFRLSLDEPETAQISFYGADGRVLPVQKLGVESGNLLLKVTGKLATGVYILTVDERGQTRKHRLIVE
jgi:hypothetical protein